VSRRTRNIALVVVAIVVVLWIVGYTLFNVGGYAPGNGEGEPLNVTTP
jgi:hypothetical protein